MKKRPVNLKIEDYSYPFWTMESKGLWRWQRLGDLWHDRKQSDTSVIEVTGEEKKKETENNHRRNDDQNFPRFNERQEKYSGHVLSVSTRVQVDSIAKRPDRYTGKHLEKVSRKQACVIRGAAWTKGPTRTCGPRRLAESRAGASVPQRHQVWTRVRARHILNRK